jgi:hypothetical protein
METRSFSFESWKKKVFRLAKRAKAGHLIPNGNDLYNFWYSKTSAEDVVAKHCTLEASRLRHKLDN